MKQIIIRSRLGEHTAITDGAVAVFDNYDSIAERDIRHYLLLDESVKLMHEPWGWQNRWYADLVRIERINDAVITVTDLCLDVIIEGTGPTYRVIDLEDFADALVTGRIQADGLRDPLYKLQRFLDNHLHGGKDFPPSSIRRFVEMKRTR